MSLYTLLLNHQLGPLLHVTPSLLPLLLIQTTQGTHCREDALELVVLNDVIF